MGVTTNQAVSAGTPIAQEYTADTTKDADTTTVVNTGVVSSSFVKPIVYTVPGPTVSHVSVPTSRFIAGSNQFYTAGNTFNYPTNPTTFYTSRPFFYTQRFAPFNTFSNVVNTFPF